MEKTATDHPEKVNATLNPHIILQKFGQLMGLSWFYGDELPIKNLTPNHSARHAYVGYFSFIHPYPITVFGKEELNYLNNLASPSFMQTIQQILALSPYLLIIADNQPVPKKLFSQIKQSHIPLFTSSLPGQTLIERLNHELTSLFSECITLPGVFLDVLGVGVLLTGKSGIGKSELALGLIHCGHRLIADDAVIYAKISEDTVIGSCPSALQDFLEVRGLGIINIRAMFGDSAIKDSKRLQIIVKIETMDPEQLQKIDRLSGIQANCNILGVNIPEVTIPVAPGRYLAVLVEAAVRNHILKSTGYQASEEFIARQQKFLEKNSL